MGSVNVTVRIEEETKREFDIFCDNVGINVTTAFNMFIKATLRSRQLPFTVTDMSSQKYLRSTIKEAFKNTQDQPVINDAVAMNGMNAEIVTYRKEKSATT